MNFRELALRHPARIVLAGFAAWVSIGTVLLMLPIARSGPGGTDLLKALFTAFSATCVVGQTVVDTGTYWTAFGHVVLLVLVQVGGLGIMAFASLLGMVVAGRLGLRSRMLAQAETKGLDLGTVTSVLASIVRISLAVEAVIWVVLSLRLWTGYDMSFGRALWYGLFHAVTAYNNAGLSLWPDNLVGVSGDPFLIVPIAAAFMIGTVGYPVLLELSRRVRPRDWSLHTKLTLVTSAFLSVIGPVLVLADEWGQPGTLGGLSWGHRLLSGIFTGLTPRTAGFNTIDYSQADSGTLLVTDALMFVGGGSAGTGGGIKVTTLAVLALAVLAEVRGQADVNAFGRRIADAVVRQALAVTMLSATVVLIGTMLMLSLTELDLDVALFETISAFGTTGLSTGISARLDPPAQTLLMVLMFIGRVGPITFATALALRSTQQAYRYAEGRPIVG